MLLMHGKLNACSVCRHWADAVKLILHRTELRGMVMAIVLQQHSYLQHKAEENSVLLPPQPPSP